MLNIDTRHTIKDDIAQHGYSVIPASAIEPLTTHAAAWDALRAEYPLLPSDNHLPGNGKYRFRRYDRFYFHPSTGELRALPHQDYFQSTDINAVTGGMVRRFAPLLPSMIRNPFLQAMIRFDFAQFPMYEEAWTQKPWQVDVHMIYVTAEPNAQGHPTPEGVHRDGAEFVTVHLAALNNASGAVVTVYDDDKRPLESFQLDHLMHSYLFEDRILWHGVTPLVPTDGVNQASRGILTFDYHFAPDLQRPQ
jgi:hypothetical protein